MRKIIVLALLSAVALTVIVAVFYEFEVEYSEGYATKVKLDSLAYTGPLYKLHSGDGEWVSTAITFSDGYYHFVGIRPREDGKYMAFLLIRIWERFTRLGVVVIEVFIPIPAPRS